MHHRSIYDIFPAYYSPIPDEEEIIRMCHAHFSVAQTPDDLIRWIQQTACPYLREAYAEGMYLIIQQGLQAEDAELHVNDGIREEVDTALNRIIRYSRADQLANEMYISETEQLPPNGTGTLMEHIQSMEQQIHYLTQEVKQIKEEKTQPPTLLWPTYGANVTEEDKLVFENQIRKICGSRKRNLTTEVKMYLQIKVKDGTIIRPEQQNTEWEILKQFGYPFAEKSYYNS